MTENPATELAVDTVEEIVSETTAFPTKLVVATVAVAALAAGAAVGYKLWRDRQVAESDLLLEDDEPEAPEAN